MKEPNPKFLELLKEKNVTFPKEVYEDIVATHGEGTLDMLEALIDRELISKKDAGELWGGSIGVTYVDPFQSIIHPEAVQKIPEEIARKTCVMALYEINDVITVVAANPLDREVFKRLESLAQTKISALFAFPSDIERSIEINYCNEKSLNESIKALEATQSEIMTKVSTTDLALLSESTQLIKIFDALLYLAIKERTSDVHIEPGEDRTEVRFRIDGNLRHFLKFSATIHPAIIARCKILCNLNIAETRIPQDGRFALPLGESEVSFRVSFVPTPEGEKCVLRILAPTNKKDFLTLDDMLVSQSILKPFKRIIDSPNGIIFVTGPTGSGKTTTLYAALYELNDPGVNISTIEDPIEIKLPGLNQTQVNHGIGLHFPTLLRAFLRQDPDIILVGEIRDKETAKIATEAALTGHLVLSTLHTNSATQAVIRLVEMGVAPYMVAPSILAVLAQRLAARVCDRCKQAFDASPDLLRKYFDNVTDQKVTLYKGIGCQVCRNTGYKGRVSFHELVTVTENMRTLIAENASVQVITSEAEKAGYKPLRYDGIKKALLGLTTLEEIASKTSVSFSS